MSKTEKVLGAALVAALLVLVFAIHLASRPVVVENKNALSGVVSGGEYNQSTTTRNFDGTALTNLSVLNVGPGALGQVCITGAGAGTINLFNATTSNKNLRTGNIATSSLLITTIPVSTTANCYGEDMAFTTGLLYEIIGTAPTSTIAWRGY